MIEYILVAAAVIGVIIAIVLLVVDYRTMRDTWNKVEEMEHRMNRLERKRKEWHTD